MSFLKSTLQLLERKKKRKESKKEDKKFRRGVFVTD
jgi:hypothetical protein